jgi:hypothetical protein
MQVICLEEAAFYTLIEQVVARLKETHGEEKEKWMRHKTFLGFNRNLVRNLSQRLKLSSS